MWSIIPNGPNATSVHDMEASGNVLYSVQGGVTGSWANQYLKGYLETFSGEQWESQLVEDVRDLLSLAIDPADPFHVFAGSWGYGLLEFKGQEVIRYTEENSSLQTIIAGGDSKCRV